MAYVPNNAQTGNQSLFSITISSTVTPIYYITSCKHSGKTNKKVDITSLQSTGVEELLTMSDFGSFDLTINRVSSDPGWIGLQAAWAAKAYSTFTLVLPMTAAQSVNGDKYVFTGVVETFDDVTDITSDKQMVTNAKVAVSGAWTFTAGS
jgi:hypothetical protein